MWTLEDYIDTIQTSLQVELKFQSIWVNVDKTLCRGKVSPKVQRIPILIITIILHRTPCSRGIFFLSSVLSIFSENKLKIERVNDSLNKLTESESRSRWFGYIKITEILKIRTVSLRIILSVIFPHQPFKVTSIINILYPLVVPKTSYYSLVIVRSRPSQFLFLNVLGFL